MFRLRQVLALTGPVLLLTALLLVATSIELHGPGFLVVPLLLMLNLALPAWSGARLGVERLLRAGTGVGAALVLGLALLRGGLVARMAATLGLFVLLVVAASVVLHLALTPRAALGALLGALLVPAALLVAQPVEATAALDRALRGPTPWVTALILALGAGALARVRWRGLAVAVYLLVSVALAAYWRWGGPLAEVAAVRGLRGLEVRAAGYLPAFIAIGAGAQALLALLFPHHDWRRAARADCCALLILAGVPVVARILPLRPQLFYEAEFHLAWLAWFSVALLALRGLVALRFLLRAAGDVVPLRGRDARLALAFLVVCLAFAWPATIWRSASLGLGADEPQYYAATMSLWDHHTLHLAPSLYSDAINPVLEDVTEERPLHASEDATFDHLSFAPSLGTPRQTFFFPLVAGPGVGAQIVVVNPGIEVAGTEVTFRDAAGAVVETRRVVVEPGRAAAVVAPLGGGDWGGATLAAGKPVLAAARVRIAGAGEEIYAGAVPTPRHCLPFDLAGRAWSARLLVQAGVPSEVAATWRVYDVAGALAGQGAVVVAANGVTAQALALPVATGAICLTGDAPVAAALVATAAPGLLVQQGQPAGAVALAVPARHITLGFGGRREVLLHNPGADDATVAIDRAGAREERTVPSHGTLVLIADDATPIITAPDALIATVLEIFDTGIAALTSAGSAAEQLFIPAGDPGAGNYAVAQIELTNHGASGTQAVATLRDADGQVVWMDKIAVCAGCTVSKPFWYRGAGGLVLVAQAHQPLTGALVQRAIVEVRPSHGIGLSLALLPGYALAGYQGALFANALLAALLALAIYALLRRATCDAGAALALAALCGATSPLVTGAMRLYAEIGGSALIALAVLCADDWRRGRGWAILGVPPCLAGALLFHGRLVPLALVVGGSLVALVLVRLVRRRAGPVDRRWIGGALVALVAAALLAGMVAAREPRLQPAYLRQFLATATFPQYALGVLFDRGSGLIPAAPIFLLAAGGFVAAVRRAPYLGLTGLALASVQFLAVALRAGGWEAWGPPGRYILPAVPWLALALGAGWRWQFRRPVRLLAGGLALWGLACALYALWLPLGLTYTLGPPSPYWHTDVILPPLLGANPLRLFPQITSPTGVARATLLAWGGVLLAGLLLGLPWALPRRAAGTAPPAPAGEPAVTPLDAPAPRTAPVRARER